MDSYSPNTTQYYGGTSNILAPCFTTHDVDNDALTCSYQIDGSTKQTVSVAAPTTSKLASFAGFNVKSLTEGTHTMTLVETDGIATTTQNVTFIVDNTSPTLPTINLSRTTVGNTPVTFTINGSTDGGSGVNHYDYQINGGAWNTYSTTVTVSADGTNTVNARAVDAVGNISAIKSATALNDLMLLAPLNVIAIATNDSIIHLTWDPVLGADSYIVECDGVQNSAGTNLWYNNIGLISGSTHKYRVCAVKGGVNGLWSDYASITLPTVPQNIVITPAGTSILVSWDGLTGSSGYDIEVDGIVKSNGLEISFKHTGLKPLTSHTYRVRAKNLGGAGTWSQLQTKMTTGGLPGVPSNIISKATGSKVTLSWDSSIDAESYEVVKVVNGIEGKTFEAGTSTTFENNGLNFNSTYTYKIRGVNSIGVGAWSNPIAVTTCGLETPENINTIETDNSITLTWSKVSGASSYDIDVKRVLDSGELVTVGTVTGISNSSYIWTGLNPETEYSITIKAKNNSGEGAFSEDMTVVTLPTKPSIPQNVNAMISDNIITINWDLVDGALGYDVELDSVVLENDNSNVYVNKELRLSEAHTYRVRARNSAIEGEWSGLQSIKTLPGKALAPNGIVVKATQIGSTITWNPVDSTTGYDIEIFDGTKTYVVENITKTTFTHRRISANTECKYRIRTKNVEGKGDWSNYIINNAIKTNCNKNSTVDLGLTASDVTDFIPYTMVVTYNAGMLNVVDLCTITGQTDTTVGKIDGTDVTIKEFAPGRIVFSVDKVVNPGEAWTGIVNSIKFMAKATGGTTITYTVFYNSQE